MKVTVLGSGSNGNSTLVEVAGTKLLIDAGFSGVDVERRLQQVGVDIRSIDGLFITHEHIDHTRGMGVLARRFGLPLFLTTVTREVCSALLTGREEIREYSSTSPVRIGTLEVSPFLTVHDAADPIAVTVRDVVSGRKLGIATDLGRPTATVRAALAGCDLLVLEANHDEAMLWSGPYPWSVKQRIASSHGHLSNRAAGALAHELWHHDLRGIILAHLSEHCNDASLARDVIAESLDSIGFDGFLVVAGQDVPLGTVDLQPPVSAGRQSATGQLSLL